ncbi:hypothetical protein B0J13DRAFT_116961 [Dactylonectria estremocensis]|uniref:Zn(2)-C6 fungal-type domain-containing protein n=1 Tax=Dactylonectria estremocensis TaxID=1079267 RepID=A0A9P9JFR5_9HYPO|nr:hypothetical protein B0J13DRAFT_116961 [Dactylonectria estremocensis]
MASEEQSLESPSSPNLFTTNRHPATGALDLLATVYALANRRREALRARTDAGRLTRYAKRSVLDAQQRNSVETAVGQRLSYDAEIKARKEAAQRRIRARVEYAQTIPGLSSADLHRIMDEELDRVRQRGMWRVQGETDDEWRARVKAMADWLDRICAELFGRMWTEKLRYVDGFPMNTMTVHQYFLPRVMPVWSGREKCLQCRAKRMRCSHTARTGYSWDVAPECSRCRLNGDTCMQKERGQPDDEEHWQLAAPEKRLQGQVASGDVREGLVDKKALFCDLMANRRRDGVKMALPAWHENDKPENKTDWEYEPTQWWQVLNGRPAKWRASDIRGLIPCTGLASTVDELESSGNDRELQLQSDITVLSHVFHLKEQLASQSAA